MSCNCFKQSQERLSYENIKSIAIKWAANSGKVVFIYRTTSRTFGFMEVDCPEAKEFEPLEFVHPVMGK